MNSIDLNSFVQFCKTLTGQKLETPGGKPPFVLDHVTDNAFYFQMPDKALRKQAIRYVERILERYSRTHSLNPGHYADISPNGMYIVALIKLYEESGKNVTTTGQSPNEQV